MTPARRWYSQGRKILAWSALRKQEAISFGQRGTETTDVEVGPLRLVGIGGVISALAVESSTKPPPIGARQTKANFSPGQATRRKLFFTSTCGSVWWSADAQKRCIYRRSARPLAEEIAGLVVFFCLISGKCLWINGFMKTVKGHAKLEGPGRRLAGSRGLQKRREDSEGLEDSGIVSVWARRVDL